ncbi:MAG: PH domain-containing protein [Oscillospiraceae bacterium]|nr:PH domain-containing protein [Oscillospiraceae bacterium]
MAKYMQQKLDRGEHVVHEAKVGALTIVGLVAPNLGLIFIPLMTLRTINLLFFTRLGFTNRRVLGKTGIFRRRVVDCPLNQVRKIAVSKGVLGRVFGYGTVTISTANERVKFKYITNPEVFRDKLAQAQQRATEVTA